MKDLEKRIDKSKSIVFRDTFAINSEKFIYTGHTNIYNQPDGDGGGYQGSIRLLQGILIPDSIHYYLFRLLTTEGGTHP